VRREDVLVSAPRRRREEVASRCLRLARVWLLAALLGAPTLATHTAEGAERRYELVVSRQSVTIDGEARPAITLNGMLPGPTLTFELGDEAVIAVRNDLDEPTSVHWHGLLLPQSQDGVPFLTTPEIAPGRTLIYRFPIRQTGTYWYHSHSGLQEQVGHYGAIVITDPAASKRHPVERDHVIVLSDWTDEAPSEVMRTLMRGSDWYTIRKGNMPSLAGAIASGRLSEYLQREWSRMPAMDLSDVAYDAFLANGQSATDLPALRAR